MEEVVRCSSTGACEEWTWGDFGGTDNGNRKRRQRGTRKGGRERKRAQEKEGARKGGRGRVGSLGLEAEVLGRET